MADRLQLEGIQARVINMHTVKPIDKEIILKAVQEIGRVVVIEDHNIIGGLGSAVAEVVAESGIGTVFRRLGLNDFSKGYGTYAQVKEMNGIGIEQIYNRIKLLM